MPYDFVICSSLLHELLDDKGFLQDIKNVCSESTVVHINVPNAYSFHRLLAEACGIIGDVHKMTDRNLAYQQSRVYGLSKLIEVIEDAGGKIISKGSYFVKPFTHGQMQAMLDDRIIDEKILDGFYHMLPYLPEYGSEIYSDFRFVR